MKIFFYNLHSYRYKKNSLNFLYYSSFLLDFTWNVTGIILNKLRFAKSQNDFRL